MPQAQTQVLRFSLESRPNAQSFRTRVRVDERRPNGKIVTRYTRQPRILTPNPKK